jgi:hypothetical protein
MIALVLALSLGQMTPEQVQKVNQDRLALERGGMWVLTGWSTINLVGGGAGLFAAEDPEWRAFHGMSALFNVINLGLSINGLVKAYTGPTNLSLEASRKASQDAQLGYGIPLATDPLYLALGAILLWQGNVRSSPVLKGFGKSLLLQGLFLIIFDFAMLTAHNTVGAPLRAGTQSAF